MSVPASYLQFVLFIPLEVDVHRLVFAARGVVDHATLLLDCHVRVKIVGNLVSDIGGNA